MAKQDAITAEYVRSILHYDPETGDLRWKHRNDKPGYVNSRWVGKIAGHSRKDGYSSIMIDGYLYLVHRLAWLYVTGKWPCEHIDHINLDPSDNCFSNLREATRSQNAANSHTPISNTSGVKGVSWFKASSKWMAQIENNGKHIHLGLFSTKEKAHAAYVKAAKEHFGEFARMK